MVLASVRWTWKDNFICKLRVHQPLGDDFTLTMLTQDRNVTIFIENENGPC